MEAGGPEERASSSATRRWPQCPEQRRLHGPPLGTKTRSRGRGGLPLERAAIVQASGVRKPDARRTDLFFFFFRLFYFVLKQQGLAKANGSFQFWSRVRRWDGPHMHASQTDFSQFVFLTHWKPHSSEKIHLTCWGLLSRNVSSDCCVNTATLSEPPSQRDGVICQEKNTTQTLRGGVLQSSKGGWVSNWTRRFPDYTLVTDPSKGHRCTPLSSHTGPHLCAQPLTVLLKYLVGVGVGWREEPR